MSNKTKNKNQKKKKQNKKIKINKKYIIISFFIILIPMLIVLLLPKETNDMEIKLQIIQYDNLDDSIKIVDEIKVKEKQIINLEKYNGNDIKILKISDNNVIISRDSIRYKIIYKNGPYSGKAIDYTTKVLEKIDYNIDFVIDIDERNPFGPEYAQTRYTYQAKFIK